MEESLLKARQEYAQARKKGRQEHLSGVAQGRSGFIPSLDGLLQNDAIASEISIGTHEIPLKKIIGTVSHSRALMFSESFLPLAKSNSEFMLKWAQLYMSQLAEGIREPVKLYEYLNWFYVNEGNKRVSLLKYLDAYSIRADVTRLLPSKQTNDPSIETYYQFVEFNNVTGIFDIWFKKPGGFITMLDYLGNYKPDLGLYKDKYQLFYYKIYKPFRKLYFEAGGDQLKCTTGDALLKFLDIYGLPQEVTKNEHEKIIHSLFIELQAEQSAEPQIVEAEPMSEPADGLVSTILDKLSPSPLLRVAFIHSGNVNTSGWTFVHEQGRLSAQESLQGQISTNSIFDVSEESKAYKVISEAAETSDVIFTASPDLLHPSLQAALKYPGVRFFNCNRKWSYKHVWTYFGRSYEVRFILGVIAGALTRTNTIGFIAGMEIPETRASANAFGLGAASVNPYARIHLRWTGRWDDPAASRKCAYSLCSQGVDIVSQNVLPPPGDTSGMYGLYGIREKKDCNNFDVVHYAQAVWNWGIFYQRILEHVLSGTLKTSKKWIEQKASPINFWWGMDSQVIDIEYTKENIPPQVLKTVEHIKTMIVHKELNPFQGPITDQAGTIRFREDTAATYREMLNQSWLVDNIISSETV